MGPVRPVGKSGGANGGRSFQGLPVIHAGGDAPARVVDDLKERLVGAGVVLHQCVVVHGGEGALFLPVLLQRLHIGALGIDEVGLGESGGKLHRRDGEEVLILGAVGPEEIAEQGVDDGGEMSRPRP